MSENVRSDEAVMTQGANETAPKPGLSLTSWFVILCWPLLVAALAHMYQGKQIADIPSDVLVVDDIALIKLAIDNGADRYNPDSIRAEVERIVSSNGMDDTVLLSRSMILYAPKSKQVSVSSRHEPEEPARTMK